MLTQQQVLDAVRDGRRSECLDGRDYARLLDFFPVEQWGVFGFGVKEGISGGTPRPWTEEEILKQLARDVAFGLEKAYGERGISASLMYEVVKMWMWVMEDPLKDDEDYGSYGLPYFREVAQKYNFTEATQ